LKRAAATSWDARLDSGLHDKQLGIAGAGDIGVFTAVRCAPFFTSVRGLNSDGRACEGFDHCYARLDIDEFATGLDVLVLILPDTPATDGLFDEDVLARLNHGALVINAGRANSLETGALTRLLRSGHIGASVLDVFENEPLSASDSLWDEPNLYVTSHTAAPTPMSAIVDVFLDNLERYRCGAELQGLIDFDRGY
ncbi:MAG: NAD(P)-dependent oxidoreductase, partial [Pseudomonadota bacterium]